MILDLIISDLSPFYSTSIFFHLKMFIDHYFCTLEFTYCLPGHLKLGRK